MSVDNALKWIDGRGWLVLSASPTFDSEIRALTLARAKAMGGVAYIGLDVDDAEDALEDMSELGAPTGYLVNIMTEDDETIHKRLTECSVVIIPGDYPVDALINALKGAAIDALKDAFERGVVILAESRSASVFGKIVSLYSGRMIDGLNWVEDAVIIPDILSITDSEDARVALETKTVKVAVGLGSGSALVLGPSNLIEIWGEKHVTIGFGHTNENDAK